MAFRGRFKQNFGSTLWVASSKQLLSTSCHVYYPFKNKNYIYKFCLRTITFCICCYLLVPSLSFVWITFLFAVDYSLHTNQLIFQKKRKMLQNIHLFFADEGHELERYHMHEWLGACWTVGLLPRVFIELIDQHFAGPCVTMKNLEDLVIKTIIIESERERERVFSNFKFLIWTNPKLTTF